MDTFTAVHTIHFSIRKTIEILLRQQYCVFDLYLPLETFSALLFEHMFL